MSDALPMMPTTRDTRAASFAEITTQQTSRLQIELVAVLRWMHEQGTADASMKELQQVFETTYQRRLEMSTLSSTINRLVTAQVLVRKDTPRRCTISKREVMPICIPRKQAALF